MNALEKPGGQVRHWIVRTLVESAKFGVGLILLALLWRKGLIDPVQLGRGFSRHPWLMAIGIGIHGILFFSLAVRWKIVLRANGIRVATHLVTRLTLVSHFFSTCLPGNGAGDLVKGWMFSRHGHAFEMVLGTMVLDRIVGMAGLFVSWSVFLFVGMAIHPGSASLLLPFLVFALLAGAALLGIAAFSGRLLASLDGFAAVRHKPSGRILQFARRALLAVATGGASWSTLASMLALSLLIQSSYVATAWLAGRILSIPASLLACGAVLPLVSLVNALPLSPGGIGVGESVGAAAMSEFGVAGNAGAQIVLVVRIVSAFWAVAGSICYLSMRWAKGTGSSPKG